MINKKFDILLEEDGNEEDKAAALDDLDLDDTDDDDTLDPSIFGDDDDDDDDDDDFDWDSFERWADKVHVDIVNEDDDKMSLTDALERTLAANIASHDTDAVSGTFNQGNNLLIIGKAGAGKSAIIRDWIKRKKLNYLELTGSQLDTQTVKGTPFRTEVDDVHNPGHKKNVVQNLNNTTFDALDADPTRLSVLFVDEINRSYAEARASILKIVQDHRVPDHNSPTGDRLVKNLVFTIAAMNPADAAHEGAEALDIAMLTRFTVFRWDGDPKEFVKFLESEEKRIKHGMKRGYQHKKFSAKEVKKTIALAEMRTEIAKKLLIDAGVQFSDDDELTLHQEQQKPVLNSRTLLTALRMTNSPRDFLKWYDKTCGASQEQIEDFEPFLDTLEHTGGTEISDTTDSMKDIPNAAFDDMNASTYDKFEKWKKNYLNNNK